MGSRLRVGLTRLWIVLSLGWVIAVAVATFIAAEMAHANDLEAGDRRAAEASADAAENSAQATATGPWTNYASSPQPSPDFTKPPPKHGALSFDDLEPAPNTVLPVIEVGAVAALAPPAAAWAFGWGLAWAISGLRPKPE